MFFLGLIGLAGYWGYYIPFWQLGEPFFKYSSDTGWYYPTIYGHLIAALVYSLIYWLGYFVLKLIRSQLKNEH